MEGTQPSRVEVIEEPSAPEPVLMFPNWLPELHPDEPVFHEVIDLTGDLPERRFQRSSTADVLAQYATVLRPAVTTDRDATAARKRALLGLYVDERA